jgi:HEAT repeat protein
MLVAKAIERCQERIRLAQEKNKNDQKLIIQQKKITDSLLKLIEDEDPDVRFAAIEACKKIDDPAVVHALEKSVKSEKNTFVRIAAEGTLSSMLKRRHRL